MNILGIESSCDDTSVALVECSKKGFIVLEEKTASQVEIHKKYGGVVPEVAGRLHAEHIVPVIEEVMKGEKKPDAIAVTAGPGLITGLLVGVEAAKTLSYLWDVPLVAVNHIKGHVMSVLLNQESEILFPALCLIVSGGHSELLLMKDESTFELIGKTRDDAAGEAFDKVGKLIGLEYPGGPKISKLAHNGNSDAIQFPRPMIDSNDFDFSFAGLKTAALYWLQEHKEYDKNDFCASFVQAIIDVLTQKTKKAIDQYQPKTLILGGGVSANKKLRNSLKSIASDTQLLLPLSEYCMDNGAMIAAAGYADAKKKNFINWREIQANPNWRVYE